MELFINTLGITAAIVVGLVVTPKVIRFAGAVARFPAALLRQRRYQQYQVALAEQRQKQKLILRSQAVDTIDSDSEVNDLVRTLQSAPYTRDPRDVAAREQNKLRNKALAELRAVVPNYELRQEIIEISRLS